jgi:hypothetical protein
MLISKNLYLQYFQLRVNYHIPHQCKVYMLWISGFSSLMKTLYNQYAIP